MSRPSAKSSKPAKSATAKPSRKKPSGFKIVIRAQEWRVRFRPVPKKLWTTPGVRVVGCCNHEKRLILVDPNEETPFWTLFHELTHAAMPDNDEHSVEWMEVVAQKLFSRYPKLKL
jgi:hypothetical protein